MLRAATGVLQRLGCCFNVEDNQGRTFTNIEPPKVRRPKKHTFKDLQITQRLRLACPGEQLVFQAPGIPLNYLQKAITAAAHRVIGAGAYASQQIGQDTVVLTVTGVPSGFAAEVEEVMHALNQGAQA
jgi:hypothetical protein